MGEFTIKLPDVGEGIAEAELTAWHVKVGDIVREDDIIAEVMTEKAAVEIPTEVTGKVIWLGGEPGDMLAIGGDLARIEVEGEGNRPRAQAAPEAGTPREPPEPPEQPAVIAPEPAPAEPAAKSDPGAGPEAAPRPLPRPAARRREG
ncbi:MAG: biotin/lipoyl-containing protein, partial [Jhaorihella sp.]